MDQEMTNYVCLGIGLGTISRPAAAAALSFSKSSSVRSMTLGRRPGSVTLLTVVALEAGTLDQRAIGTDAGGCCGTADDEPESAVADRARTSIAATVFE